MTPCSVPLYMQSPPTSITEVLCTIIKTDWITITLGVEHRQHAPTQSHRRFRILCLHGRYKDPVSTDTFYASWHSGLHTQIQWHPGSNPSPAILIRTNVP